MNEYIKLLVVDDEQDSRETFKMLLESQGFCAVTARSAEEALALLEKEFFHIIVTDLMMPGMGGMDFLAAVKERYQEQVEVIMVTGYGSIETAVEAMKQGAFGYFVKSHDPAELFMEIKKAVTRLEMNNIHTISREETDQYLLESKSPKMQNLWKLVDLVADSNANVLITGESGVGKEIVAEQIHKQSGRRAKPFIAINCQQYPYELIESELFGHEKGAFTGAAARRIGKLEQAAGGTVFLDEIGDISMEVQVKLLRVLERKEIERVGSNVVIPVDFRLVAATNQDLEELVKRGEFRQDLFFRLNTIEAHVPPLRERQEDLPALINFFVRKYERETGKSIRAIDERTEDFLLHHEYVGNVRELKNLIERMVLLSAGSGVLSMAGAFDGLATGGAFDGLATGGAGEGDSSVNMGRRGSSGGRFDDRADSISEGSSDGGAYSGSGVQSQEGLTYKEAKQNFERAFILDTLRAANGNITRAAEKMGLSRRQLFNKIVELEIDVAAMR